MRRLFFLLRRAATSSGDKKRERALLLGSRRVHVNRRAGDLLFQPRRCVRRASVVPGRDQPAAAGRGYAAGYVTPRACDFRRGRQQRGRLRRKRRRPPRPLGTPLHDTCGVATPAALTVTNISSACKRVSGPMSVVAALALLWRRRDACRTSALERGNMLDASAHFTWCTAAYTKGSAFGAWQSLQGVGYGYLTQKVYLFFISK